MSWLPVSTGHRAKFFDLNLQYMMLVGLWPIESWSKFLQRLYQVYQNMILSLSFIYLAVTGIGIYQSKDDTIRFLENLDKMIVAYNYIFKVLIFLIRRDQIKTLVYEILDSGDTIAEERENLMKYLVAVVTVSITSIIGGFELMSMSKGELVVDAWMPFDSLKNQWTVFISAQILAGLFVVPVLYRAISIQGIVCSIIMYICDQLVELQIRIKALTYSKTNSDAMRREFKDIIKKHIRLVGYSRSLKSVFKEYFLIQNLAVTAELCLNALMVSIVGLEQKKHLITFLGFLMVALFNAYIFCYLGQELMDQSGGIAFAAYESTWTSWPVDMQKDLLIIINAAQKNFSLSAGGIANMCMETFALALYNGYSMFAVLRDIVD